MVCLRPKMYSLKFRNCATDGATNSSTIKRAKGVGRAQVEALSHKDYRAAFENAETTSAEMIILKSVNRGMCSVTFLKQALAASEDALLDLRKWVPPIWSLPDSALCTTATRPH